MLDEDEIYMTIVALDEMYNFVVLSFFSFEDVKMFKKLIIKFQDHNNRVQVLVTL
jgi:hypothetical protein